MEACLAVAPAHDFLVNLGDVVGYNASPNEVCDRVRAMGGSIVRGNHDRACSGLTDLAEFNLVAAMSARWTQTTLRPEHLEWLRALPQGPLRRQELPGVEFVHGSPRDEDEYVLNPSTACGKPSHARPRRQDLLRPHSSAGRIRLRQRAGAQLCAHLPDRGRRGGVHHAAGARASAISSIPARWGSLGMATGGRPSPSTSTTGMRPER